jgi:hypothetical protein
MRRQRADACSTPDTLTLGEDLVGLGLGDALDGEQRLLGRKGDGLDGVEAGLCELLGVRGRDAELLPAAPRASELLRRQ